LVDKIKREQIEVCSRFNTYLLESPDDMKIGIARNVKDGLLPINGLRHLPVGYTTGWYIWAGEVLPEDDDFFVPLHVKHIGEWAPNIKKYLGLPPGWRFLIVGDYEDVWFDPDIIIE
jgi:hypothetical protein